MRGDVQSLTGAWKSARTEQRHAVEGEGVAGSSGRDPLGLDEDVLRVGSLGEEGTIPGRGVEIGSEEDRRYREAKLARCFRLYDADGSGQVEKEELLRLGRMRRELGYKPGRWGERENERLIAQAPSPPPYPLCHWLWLQR